jgi:quinol monooxygenase YgiN
VWFYELYSDMDGLTAHGTSDAMKAIGPELTALMAGRPELTFLTPVRAKGLAFS